MLLTLLRHSKVAPALEMRSSGLGDEELRSVLKSPPGERYALAKQFRPEFPYDFLQINYLVNCPIIFLSVAYVFKYAGKDPVETTEDPWTGQDSKVWSREPYEETLRGYEGQLRSSWMAKHEGSYDVLISLKLKDRVGNFYRVGLVHYKFTAHAGVVTSLSSEVLF